MRRLLPVLAVALLGLALGVAPVAAHLNHISVDDQVSDDGTLLVETTYVTEGSSWHVVAHAHNGSGPGEPIGHRTIDPGPKTAFTVTIDGDRWREFERNTTVWVALHQDDGDGQFDPADDPVFVDQFDRRRAQRISVGKRDAGRVNVVAHGFSGSQTVNESAVTVPRVRLAESGAVALHAVGENGSLGPEVGRTDVGAGVSRNVTVDIDDSFFAERGDRFELWVVAAHGATPVRVGGDPVASLLGVEKGAPIENASDDGGSVDSSLGAPPSSPTPTASSTATAGDTATSSRTGPDAGSPTDADGPGFGVGLALLALLALASLSRARNR